MGKNRAVILNCLVMILAAFVLRIVFRYWAGEYQGYFTFPVGHVGYGFAHIKSTTEWVMGHQLFPLPDFLLSAVLPGSLAWLAYEVRKVYKSWAD